MEKIKIKILVSCGGENETYWEGKVYEASPHIANMLISLNRAVKFDEETKVEEVEQENEVPKKKKK
jgi:hypothetical protein